MKKLKVFTVITCAMAALMLASCTVDSSFKVTVSDITATSAAVYYEVENFSKLKSLTESLRSEEKNDSDSIGKPVSMMWTRGIRHADGSSITPDQANHVYNDLTPDTEYILKAKAKIGWGSASSEVRFRTLTED